MIIDFHVHGKVTAQVSTAFGAEELEQKISEAKTEGLTAFAITEHANCEKFFEAVDFLDKNYNYINQHYDVDGFRVYIGVEVFVSGDLDITFVGEREYIKNLRNTVEQKRGKSRCIALSELAPLCDFDNSLVFLAHPFRRHENFPDIDKNFLKKLDYIELNASDIYKKGESVAKNEVYKLAKDLDLPVLGGSDAHHFIETGSIKNVFTDNCETISEIKQQIKMGNFKVEIMPSLAVRKKSGKLIKRLLYPRILIE